jgi:dTDP-4-dehydrorhamnose 3,5-epimerase-like enzyme
MINKKVEQLKLINLKVFSDARGSLISLEQNKNVPFKIKRVYYIFNTKKYMPRGFHAHKNLEQILICISGSCKIKVDNGKSTKIFELFSPDQGLYIGKNIWREMFDFSKSCILLVIASGYYNSKEYIRNYEEFLSGEKGHNDVKVDKL